MSGTFSLARQDRFQRARIKNSKAKEKELSEQIIPSKLEEFGVLDIKLADGSRISAEPFTLHVSQLKRLMMLTNGYEIMVTAIL